MKCPQVFSGDSSPSKAPPKRPHHRVVAQRRTTAFDTPDDDYGGTWEIPVVGAGEI